MNTRNDFFSQLQQNLSDLIANSPAADLEKNVKAFMGQTFNRMDLLTRDEFDSQVAVLERALARVAALEQRVQELEAQLGQKSSTDEKPTES
ncbi:MAG: accessory factor UbiK family protein [Alcaligenaceae bacterium]|uniref:Ubiquinone biosynthesis accessory factor UbiK n=1 Tax=Paenalcaligenes hermetiae TaxID=1157987 RepID=A0ABP9M6R4_9BURK|nr:accessory factor UbiK family protein [Alcaligenaceae bacterium]